MFMVRATGVKFDLFYSSIQMYVLLGRYLCFISFYILIGMN